MFSSLFCTVYACMLLNNWRAQPKWSPLRVQNTYNVFPNLLKFVNCFQKPRNRLVTVFCRSGLTENTEEKQPVMVRNLPPVVYCQPLILTRPFAKPLRHLCLHWTHKCYILQPTHVLVIKVQFPPKQLQMILLLATDQYIYMYQRSSWISKS